MRRAWSWKSVTVLKPFLELNSQAVGYPIGVCVVGSDLTDIEYVSIRETRLTQAAEIACGYLFRLFGELDCIIEHAVATLIQPGGPPILLD